MPDSEVERMVEAMELRAFKVGDKVVICGDFTHMGGVPGHVYYVQGGAMGVSFEYPVLCNAVIRDWWSFRSEVGLDADYA